MDTKTDIGLLAILCSHIFILKLDWQFKVYYSSHTNTFSRCYSHSCDYISHSPILVCYMATLFVVSPVIVKGFSEGETFKITPLVVHMSKLPATRFNFEWKRHFDFGLCKQNEKFFNNWFNYDYWLWVCYDLITNLGYATLYFGPFLQSTLIFCHWKSFWIKNVSEEKYRYTIIFIFESTRILCILKIILNKRLNLIQSE